MKNLLLLITLLSLLTNARAQKIKNIKLTNQSISYAPTNFHIAGFVDERADTTNIGSTKIGIIGKTTTLNLQDGAATALTRFVNKNVRQQERTLPIIIHIKKFEVVEESAVVAEKSTLNAGFEFYSGEDKIFEYSGSSYTQASYDASLYISSMISRFVEGSIQEADKFLEENKDALTPSVKVEIEMSQTPEDNDHIAYKPGTLLRIQDFDGNPDDLSLAAGATYSSITTNFSSQIRGKQVTVKIKITPMFDRLHSWLKDTGKNAEVLSHEQAHFDITAIHAAKFAEAIRAFQFTTKRYDEELNTLYKTANKEHEAYQLLYDTETKHGVNKTKQKEWKQKIQAELAAAGM